MPLSPTPPNGNVVEETCESVSLMLTLPEEELNTKMRKSSKPLYSLRKTQLLGHARYVRNLDLRAYQSASMIIYRE